MDSLLFEDTGKVKVPYYFLYPPVENTLSLQMMKWLEVFSKPEELDDHKKKMELFLKDVQYYPQKINLSRLYEKYPSEFIGMYTFYQRYNIHSKSDSTTLSPEEDINRFFWCYK